MVHYGRWKGLGTAGLYSMNGEVLKGLTPKLSNKVNERDFEAPKAIFDNIRNH
jgi:hypothetical protein